MDNTFAKNANDKAPQETSNPRQLLGGKTKKKKILLSTTHLGVYKVPFPQAVGEGNQVRKKGRGRDGKGEEGKGRVAGKAKGREEGEGK